MICESLTVRQTVTDTSLTSCPYTVHLLLQSSFCLGQHVDLILLRLKVVQSLLVSFLQSGLLSGQRRYGFIQNTHLLGKVLHLKGWKRISVSVSVKEPCGDAVLSVNVPYSPAHACLSPL